ncbi:Na+/H+ antiporter NhaA [Stygiobacter electus]|uniref:Na(+)/H(+) antiporter NhaA n=1 Tax=Stygiobacter electus TaxID=3032292 RepID=A0AAE3P3B3_9BACT|nr:Na+/H+ antiporter NhaA [Stygiobacter electus]MDF1612145.1 Na+/H+ antiporter NhaA [Stygiobacter electus]
MPKLKFDLFKEFFESEKSSGYILVALTILSLLLTNIFIGHSYINFWHSYLDLSFWKVELKYSLEHWINDGLMVIFFLLVGLEIEREIYVGELSSIKKSALPAIAALGGMLVPALIHFSLNANTPTQSGFGIPMATDIAFTLGVLSLLGNKIPLSLKIFLTALAIIDDLGAIIIIAFFYTNDLSFAYLIGSLLIFVLLLIFNRLKVNKLSIYLLLGVVMWYLMLKSGVHATIAGVLLAFAIPFNKNDNENISYKLQHFLHKPVAFIILPIFALANTAIMIPTNIVGSIVSNNSLGILFGLSLGKLIGIFAFSYVAVKIGVGILPKDLNWNLIAGASSLAGIGFTMSIFITNLAFSDVEIIASSKLIIIIASVISAISGLIKLNMVTKRIN